jgi:predicted RNA-binding Zn ribbon-like protein
MNPMERFPLVTGNLPLDLINTEVVRRGRRHDLLRSGHDVRMWVEAMVAAGALSLEQLSELDAVWKDDVRAFLIELRSFLRRLFETVADRRPLEDGWHRVLENHLRFAPIAYRWADGKLLPVPVGQPADALCSLIALQTLRLFETNQLAHLRRCSNPSCVFLFLDKSGRRKWCSMRICGNRTKVARHLQKRGRNRGGG